MEKVKSLAAEAIEPIKGYLDMFFSILTASVAAGIGLVIGKMAANFFIKDREGTGR